MGSRSIVLLEVTRRRDQTAERAQKRQRVGENRMPELAALMTEAEADRKQRRPPGNGRWTRKILAEDSDRLWLDNPNCADLHLKGPPFIICSTFPSLRNGILARDKVA